MMKRPILFDAGNGRDYWIWGDRYSFKTTSSDSEGAHALIEMCVRPGSGTPLHIHHAEDEMFYVLEGELSLWCNEEKKVAGPGSFVAVPKGIAHRWSNESDSLVRSLVFLVPAGFDEFLMKIGTPVTDAEQQGPAPTAAEIEYALSLAKDFHMEVVGEV